MENNAKNVTVRINGAEYIIKSEQPEEYVQKVAYMVDKKMRELLKNDPRLSTALGAVLTSINIADDYYRSVSDSKSLREDLLRYTEENNTLRTKYENVKRELQFQKEYEQELKITIAKLETELKQYKR